MLLRVCFIGNSKPTEFLKMADFGETEKQFPIKHEILQSSRLAGFRFILAKTRFPVEKHEDESGFW